MKTITKNKTGGISLESSLDVRLTRLEQKFAVAEEKISVSSKVTDKLDITIERLTEISSSMKEMIVLHEVKLKEQEKINAEMKNSLKDHQEEDDKIREDIMEDLNSAVSRLDVKIENISKRLLRYDYVKYFIMGILALALFLSKTSIMDLVSIAQSF